MLGQSVTTRPTSGVLVDAFPGARLRDVLAIVGYAGLVGLAAQLVIKLPFDPVPITGQTFGVLVGGMALGSRRALAGMVLYLVAGLVGVPWFAQGQGGYASVLLPSFGYIIGFVVAGSFIGRLAEVGWARDAIRVLAAMAIGSLGIYLIGATWLAIAASLGPVAALQLGVFPFLPGDVIKAVAACVLLPAATRLVEAD